MPVRTEIRKPAVAGSFYPADPGKLASLIAKLYAETDRPAIAGKPQVLIVPHAGYIYSGKIAAKAYKLLDGQEFETVVIISPSHHVFFRGSSVYEGAGYSTPLGTVEIDQELSEKLSEIGPSLFLSNQGHTTGAARAEHALEVQLPFLQIVLGKFKLVAIIMGDQEEDTIWSLGEAVAAATRGKNALIIASTDLSHFHSEKEARRLDGSIRQAVEAYDPEKLLKAIESGEGEACGAGPMAAAMLAAKRLGAGKVKVLEYGTSGETTGDFDQVVGYLSAAISTEKATPVSAAIGAPAAKAPRSDELTDEDKDILREIALDSIRARFAGRSYQPPTNERLEQRRGAFVTLEIEGHLRGCIGQVGARGPLNDTVAEMAVAAAFDDPRFPALTEPELEKIDIEVSVLSPLKRVRSFAEVKVGRDGLMIKLDLHSGLLLPQVAVERKWTPTEFLEQTCLKAGLPKNSYRDKFAEVYRFSADVF